jgi:putative aldouronate transport system permease protein
MYGIYLSFADFSIRKGVFGSEFVGFKWFAQFFRSEYFGRIFLNTVLLSLLNILFAFPFPIIFALMINEVNRKVFKKTVQTISYMPHFISTVIVVGIMVNIFSPSGGIVNRALMGMGIITEPINFFYKSSAFRPHYVGSESWQHYGWNSIIYIAALSSIDAQLYEAARIDGAGKWKQLWHVTLPGISNVIFTLLVLNFGSIMSVGFEKVLLMYKPITYETSDIIATYVYREGLLGGRLGYGSAVGLFNSVINLTLLIVFNTVSKRLSEASLW